MKRSPLKRRKGLKRTKLKKVSKKLSKELVKYYRLRRIFLQDRFMCDVCGRFMPSDRLDCHHKRGRGKYLNDVSTFVAACRNCHDHIHSQGHWARANGWLISKFER